MADQKLSTSKRREIENLIYRVFDAADMSHKNSEYYKKIFIKMSNDEFYKFLQRRLPFRFHEQAFNNEPKMDDIFKAFKVLNKPLIEKVYLPFQYINKDGIPVNSKECLVGYINIKRMKQFLTKKNSIAIENTQRDITGRLMNEDKGAMMSDREFESLSVGNLTNTMAEYSTIKADAMKAKSEAYQVIMTTGVLRRDDVKVDKSDSVSKNLLSAMLMGCNIYSNLVNDDYYTPLTLKNRQARNVERK